MKGTSAQGDAPHGKERQCSDHMHAEMTEDTVLRASGSQPRTVEVVPSGPLLDELEYKRYFEKPEMGGPVETVVVDKEKEIIWITFVSAEAARRVCCRQHRIEDQDVAVKLVDPPIIPSPNYPNKLLFRSVPGDVTKDHLSSFLENLTGCEPAEILYGDDDGVVLATFQSETDFNSVEEKCRRKKLKGQQLTAEEVPMSNCVLVENVARQTNDETIHMFFENTKRSGGGPVQRVVRLPPGNKCLVYFQHYQVVDSVLSKYQSLDNHELKTRAYLECLGQSGGRDDPAAFSMPDHLVVEDEAKVIFLSQKSTYFQLLSQTLSWDHASVSVVQNSIVVKCTLTPSIPNARALARKWTDTARQTVHNFLNELHVETIQIAGQHTWPLLETAMEDQLSEGQRSDVSVLMEASKQSVQVVGSHTKAREVAEKLRNIMKDVDALMQREKEVEEIVPVKVYRSGLLQAAAFHDEMAREYPNLTVSIGDGEVIFRGVLEEVKSAHLKMYAFLENEETVSVKELPAGTVKVLIKQHVKDYISRQFTAKGVTAVMEVRENEVVVVALSKATADRAASIVRASVATRVVQLSPESSLLLHTPDFQQAVARLTDSHPGLDVSPADNRTNITITATDDVIDDATTHVKDFISKNTTYTTELRLSPTRHKFVLSVWKQKLDMITSSLKDEKVEVTADEHDPKFCATGTRVGLSILTERYQELEEKIFVQEETIESEETLTFLNSDKRDKDLRKLELLHRCAVGFEWETPGVQSTTDRFNDLGKQGTETWSRGAPETGEQSPTIQTPKPDLSLSTKPEPVQSAKPETVPPVKSESAQASKPSQRSRTPPPRPPLPPALARRRSATLYGTRGSSPPPQLTVTVVPGEIAKQKVDVIVNSTSRDLALEKGAVSASILRAAGQGLQDECRTQYPQGITAGHMAVTGGHRLHCRQLYHLSLPQWSGQRSKQVLHATVVNCLTKCSQNGFKSIAIPALGTGNLGYPRYEVAQTMMEAIHQFQQTNPFSGLGEVKIVIYHQDAQTMMEFQKVQRPLSRRQSLPASVRQVKGKRHRRTFSDLGDLTKVPVAGTASNMGDWQCDVMGVRITVRKGDITEEDAHAVVNLVDKKLDLSKDEVGKSLRSKCGMQLEEELKTKREDISQKGLTVTPAPNLRCSMVLHVDGKRFSGNWKSGIRAVLEAAESYRAKSVAIPNLGTSASKLASDLFRAVTKFCGTEDIRHVEEVRVVLTDWLHIPEFRRALQTEMKKPRKEKRASGFGKRMFQAVKNAIPWRHSSVVAGNKTKTTSTYRPGMLQKGAKLYIYVESEEAVQDFLKAFEDHVKDKVTKMVFTDPALKSLNKSEMRKLRDIAEEADVRLEVWQEVGRYELQGVVDVLPRVQKDLSEFLRAAEHQHRERENQSLIAGMVQWSFLERTRTETTRIEYGPKENKLIETAYVQGQRTAEIVDSEGTVYVIDFDRMVEYPKDCQTAEEAVEVIRKPRESESSVTQLPDTWTLQSSDEPVKLVKLMPSEVEYQQVKKNVMATIGNSPLSIICVDRIQNVMLYQQYQAKKTHMDKQNGPGFQNEKMLWHGTSADAIQNINNHGFNRSYCGKNATAYGKGVYFATQSSYSTEHRYSPPDSSGCRFLYQCKVLVGHPTLGSSDMRFLPPSSDSVVCDSATNNLQKPDMYVIFNDTQAYPQYLITFK